MSYTICRFSGERDKKALLAFWNENHEEHLDQRYEWLYEKNPAGRAIGFLVRDDEQDTCVGCSAAHPRRFSFLDASLRGMIARDFFVDDKHRVLGPALALMRGLISAMEEDEVDFIYAYPNKGAEQVMKRVGFTCLGSWTRMVKPVGITRRLRSRQLPHCLSKLASVACGIALRLFAFETWYRFRGGFAFQEITAFDQRFDTLWKESPSRFQVTGERTSEYCAWRFLECPSEQFTVFAMFDAGGTDLKGYITTCRDENAINIADFVFPKDRKATRILLAHFLRHVRKASPDSVVVTFLENEELQNLFRRHGFTKRPCDRKVWCYLSKPLLKRLPGLNEVKNWLFLSSEVHY